ncbi:MAG: hypothetical protein F4Z67_08130 [Synechococcus sp. SB0667_bin_8]|nr:hypothetical protein [Synechococcus sp. SB0667_bin_8]
MLGRILAQHAALNHHWLSTLAQKALIDSVFTVEISLKRNPLPLTVQRREQVDAEALLQTLGGAMTSQRSELLHLNCDASSERKILLLSDEIASVQMYERSSGSSGRARRPGFSRDA